MNRPAYTRSGARRAGDDYQDVVALDLLVEWLEHPDRFEWFELEAGEMGALDDVVASRRDGVLLTRQVKFATNPAVPSDAWSWNELTETKTSKKGPPLPSHLQRWATTLDTLAQKASGGVDAALVTNRVAAPDVENTLGVDGRVDMTKLSASDRATLVAHLGGEAPALRFFAAFQFCFDRSGLEALERSVRARFSALGGTDVNWFRLRGEVRTWARFKDVPAPAGRVTLAHLRDAAGWNLLRPLAQEFTVPRDYVLPSREFHARFAKEVLDLSSGAVVLTASPGAGKSTYASYLFRRLRRLRPAVRHHYHLSSRDRDPALRLDHLRAAESLMHDLASSYGDALAGVARESPNPRDLRKWLQTCGEYYARHKRSLVLNQAIAG